MEKSDQTKSLSFEQALKQLETIAEQMADDSLELDKLLKLYEEGSDYLNHCRAKLQEAETRLTQITQDKATQETNS